MVLGLGYLQSIGALILLLMPPLLQEGSVLPALERILSHAISKPRSKIIVFFQVICCSAWIQ